MRLGTSSHFLTRQCSDRVALLSSPPSAIRAVRLEITSAYKYLDVYVYRFASF